MDSISLQEVSFHYRERSGIMRSVLKDASLLVRQGEILCICGGSGQGKSTLLRIMAGLERPQSGRLLYFGEEVPLREHNALSVSMRGVGYVFQNCALISNLRVFDNVALPLRFHHLGTEEDIREKVNSVLASMMVEEYSDKFPYALSVGIQKRVAVARALAMDPQILLMDEPTAGLDNINRRSLMALIANLRQLRHASIIIVTHDLLLAKELNSRICFLHEGFMTEPDYFDQLSLSEFAFVRQMVRELVESREP